MKIAIIGYGKMGHAIEKIALSRGHEIVATADSSQEIEAKRDSICSAHVAIEFSQPTAAANNIRQLFALNVRVVCGTTGWYDEFDSIAELCKSRNLALLTATNFSIGMNIMFDLNERLARLMQNRPEYTLSITETHHIHKLDAPSGTAITLREQTGHPELPITSIREGEVPGTHTVAYDSHADTITLTHEAHNRDGFALGAVLAAEYLEGKHGIFTMKDII